MAQWKTRVLLVVVWLWAPSQQWEMSLVLGGAPCEKGSGNNFGLVFGVRRIFWPAFCLNKDHLIHASAFYKRLLDAKPQMKFHTLVISADLKSPLKSRQIYIF